ncbi:hypothetical protein AB833_07935 [Chromatiales bacterium (ex Bugula neritina AB1)]|nr:hypothetical protein AB833_07935 [Chromatiales bacterium (ex Bugula neritina AB1)]
MVISGRCWRDDLEEFVEVRHGENPGDARRWMFKDDPCRVFTQQQQHLQSAVVQGSGVFQIDDDLLVVLYPITQGVKIAVKMMVKLTADAYHKTTADFMSGEAAVHLSFA